MDSVSATGLTGSSEDADSAECVAASAGISSSTVRQSGNFGRLDLSGPPLPTEEDPLDFAYFTGVAPKFGSTKCLILQLRDMANPYKGMPFRITHCHSEFKTHPEACLLNERTHAVRVESIDSDTLPPELSDVKNLYRITFRHGAFEWRVIRTWKRKEEKVVLSEINAMLRRLETHETTHGDSIMNPAILKFLGVSRLTFVEDAGPSLWEGEVNLRLLRNNCPQSYFRSKTRKAWMVIKDSHIAFLKNVVGQTVDLVLVDRRFKFELFRKPAQLTPTCASCCKDPGARMQLKLFNTELEAIVSVCPVSAEPLQFGLECLAANADYGNRSDAAASSAPPIKSFAPPRESTPCKWLVDGAAYFYDLAEALEQAKEEIFIADWFLSPEVLLRRPCAGYHELINILYRRATYNVQIYILIYSELTNVLNNHSQYTRKCLYEKLRKTKNIHIILHPRRSLNPQKGLVNEYLYSHHEKLAIIDQKVAFFGGLDLCWGRWDIPEH
uniref:phospholipase D n=1 Tax=Macrostomum lignano TaxID=282301 RepID=A0A1I8ILC3_9PLAT